MTTHPLYESVQARLRDIALLEDSRLTLADSLVDVSDQQGSLTVTLELGFPCASLIERLQATVTSALEPLSPNGQAVKVHWRWVAPTAQVINTQKTVEGVKNIIAVASGKGGVGKSTTAVNIALALAAEGATVGILDADIYGPSQAIMLGVANRRPEMHSSTQMKPIVAHGIQMISMGNLVTEQTPVVWRGPMVSGALQQLLNQTHWHDVDYLIVDMPPGTGDIQLTLAQAVPVAGSIIVTTPQDISLADARKGIEMFRKVNIPVLGVVENMALHICSNCGHEEAIFGEAGGNRLAQEYQVSVLGRLPLQRSICEQTDRGLPPVVAEPQSNVTQQYREIAVKMAAALWEKTRNGQAAPTISISDD